MDILKLSAPTKKTKSSSSFTDSFVFSDRQSLRSSIGSTASESNFRQSQINDLEQAAFATVVQNCYDELYVLLGVFPLYKKDLAATAPKYKTLEER